MNKHKAKQASLKRRQRRVRAKIRGTAERPRLRVTRSSAHIYAQVIDDVAGVTLVSASTLDKGFQSDESSSTADREAAKLVGELVGKRAIEAGIEEIVFDRGGHIYHGRIQALADGARSAGLKF